GEAVYNTACMACHAVGVLGAPKKGDKAAWDDKLAKGLDASLQNAINGINAMPPKGNCLNCSDDELLAAIKFMSGQIGRASCRERASSSVAAAGRRSHTEAQ